MIKEIECKSALHRIKNDNLPYDYDLNIFRGCTHGCRYCYALYSHTYLEDKEYFKNIYVKKDIVKVLENELRKQKIKDRVINLGGVTDSYQLIEKIYKIMPEILKLFIKYKTPITISTKSDLILRDYELIDELSRLTHVNIALTITAMDENIRSKIEPNTTNSKRRFEVLRELRKTNASIGVHVMPIIPFLTDNHENLDEIFYNAKLSDVNYLLCEILNLRGKTKDYFLCFVKENFPNLNQKILSLHEDDTVYKKYKYNLYEAINILSAKYNISKNYSKPIQKIRYSQPTLF